jgi:hypothetical protein
MVPLPHDYFFCMIDITDHGYLMKGGCSGSPLIDEVQEIAQSGDSLVGFSSRSGPFVLNTASDDFRVFADRAAALAQFSPSPNLQTANAFYQSLRWGWQDAIGLALLLCSLVVVSGFWFTFFIRVRSRASAV